LKETEKYLEKAILLDQNNVEYLIELASQKLSQEKIKDAAKCFMNALRKEETYIPALLGLN
jgi:cytochrome c-type biogenesis protein CcmH/NrfG